MQRSEEQQRRLALEEEVIITLFLSFFVTSHLGFSCLKAKTNV